MKIALALWLGLCCIAFDLPTVCSALAGPFAGHLEPVPRRTPPFAALVTTVGSSGVALAFLLGILLAFVSGIVIGGLVAAADDAASKTPSEDAAE